MTAAESYYIVDSDGNLIVTEDGTKIITDGIPIPEVDIVIKRPFLGLSLGLSMGKRSTF